MSSPQKPGRRPAGTAWASAADFGYNLLAGLLFLGGGGFWLDRKLGHAVPWLCITGIFLAVATALYMLVRRVIRDTDREMRMRRKDPENGDASPGGKP